MRPKRCGRLTAPSEEPFGPRSFQLRASAVPFRAEGRSTTRRVAACRPRVSPRKLNDFEVISSREGSTRTADRSVEHTWFAWYARHVPKMPRPHGVLRSYRCA
jgi:hypothetical protein